MFVEISREDSGFILGFPQNGHWIFGIMGDINLLFKYWGASFKKRHIGGVIGRAPQQRERGFLPAPEEGPSRHPLEV